MNESIILKTIRRVGPISRADIAKITGQTPSTLTNIAGKLLEDGIILEHMVGESSGGRKPVLLRVNPDAANIIIINIRTHSVCCHIADAAGNMAVPKRDYWFNKNREEVLAYVLQAIDDALKLTTSPVPAIAIIVRGPVKTKEGISIYAPNIGWRNVPLKFIVEERFGIPVLVENDVRILTMGMYYYTLAVQSQNMVLLKVGQGIGAGIIINGELYKGDNETAGEIGHTSLDMNGPICSCGRRGCWDTLSSEIALVNYVKEAMAGGRKSLVTELEKFVAEGEMSRLTMVEDGIISKPYDLIYQAAVEGDEVCLEALDQVALYLGVGIANLINIFNPETVVISGGLMRVQGLIKDRVEKVARERLLDYCFTTGKMYFSNLDEEANIKGAVDMVLSAGLDCR
jgi:predicted NBD/HSP70 family sugar kinase